MRYFYLLLYRLLMFGITAAVCISLTEKTGAWPAIGLWVVGIGGLCGAVAWQMRRQPMGRVTFFNRFAFMVLPWGYKIGRGKLLPIVIESWLRWVLIGMAIVVLASHDRYYRMGLAVTKRDASWTPLGRYHRSLLASVLLFVAWITMGAVVLRLLTFIAIRNKSNPLRPGTWPPIIAIVGLLAGSVALTISGHTARTTMLALLLSAGPVVLVAGGYGFVLLLLLTAGRKTGWK